MATVRIEEEMGNIPTENGINTSGVVNEEDVEGLISASVIPDEPEETTQEEEIEEAVENDNEIISREEAEAIEESVVYLVEEASAQVDYELKQNGEPSPSKIDGDTKEDETDDTTIQYPEPIKRQRREDNDEEDDTSATVDINGSEVIDGVSVLKEEIMAEIKNEEEDINVNPNIFIDEDDIAEPMKVEDTSNNVFSSANDSFFALEEPSKPTYFCSEKPNICISSFRTRKALRRHILINHGSFRCLCCEFETESARTLGEHGVVTHSLRVLRKSELNDGQVNPLIYCFYSNCNCKAVDEELIILHVIQEHLQLPLSKPKREYLLQKQAQHFISDTGRDIPLVGNTNSFYRCFSCDKNMESIRNIVVHEAGSHSDKLEVAITSVDGEDEQVTIRELLICSRPNCNWNTLIEDHLVLHILKCHENVKLRTAEEAELNAANEGIIDLAAFGIDGGGGGESQLENQPQEQEIPDETATTGNFFISNVTGNSTSTSTSIGDQEVKQEIDTQQMELQVSTTEDSEETIQKILPDLEGNSPSNGRHYPCSLCRLRTRNQAKLFKHLSKVHNLPPEAVSAEMEKAIRNPISVLKCSHTDCNETFNEESQLVAHEVLMHKNPIINEDVLKPPIKYF